MECGVVQAVAGVQNEAKYLSHVGTQQKCERQFPAVCGTVHSLTPRGLTEFYEEGVLECLGGQ